MNAKKLVVLTVALGLLAISSATVHAQMHTNAGFVSHANASHSFARPGTGTFHGGNWGGDWHHHHHDNSFIFIGGFPFFGFGYPFGYPYGYAGYYPYGGYYPPPYYGGGYYGSGYYGGGYYGSGYYGGGYYGSSGPVYASYAYGSGSGSQSSVMRLQHRLARAGYYRGPIDGIMGSRTRYALRAYQHDHGAGTDRMTDR
ncbi:MAG: hypothetical protein DME38_00090 [Verrucomicrobia bacterium]|nr:MAG: hypothetical protein DME38_00090 [Verrucomicrobiota bacterium]